MATINSTIKMTDRASSTLKGINSALQNTNNKMSDIKSNSSGMSEKATSGFSKMQASVIAFNQGLELAKKGYVALKAVMSFSDNLTMNKARLDLINDGLQTTADLQNMIYAAANRSRGSYDDMSKSVSKLSMLAGDAFGSNKEVVAFTETLNKAFTVSGSSQEEKSSAMYQLTQAMASGALQGDELRTIREAAPMLYDSIAKYMGKSKGELKELGAEGKITSDIIKAALFNSAEDINAQFNKMPMTFAQAGDRIKNAWQMSMQSISDRFNAAFNSEGFQRFLQIVIRGIEQLGAIIGPVVDFIITSIGNMTNFITSNWSTIQQILQLLGVVFIPMIIVALALMAWGWLKVGAQAIWAGAKMLAAWLIGLGPIGWVILAIIAIIGILKMLGVSFETIFGFIGGIVGVTVGAIMNIFIAMYNLIIDIVNGIAYGFEFAWWGIKKGIVAVVNFVLDQVLKVAKIIDKVFGSDLASKVSNMQDSMNKWAGDMPEWKEVVKRQEYVDLTEAWDTGKKIGSSVGSALDKGLDKLSSFANGLTKSASSNDYNLDDVISNGAMNTYVSGGSLDEVNISDEDLKMLKDIATRDYMLNYKHITPNVNIEFGDVRETADVGKVKDAIKKMMEDELSELYVVEEA